MRWGKVYSWQWGMGGMEAWLARRKHAETALCVAIFGLSLCPVAVADADADFGFGFGICCG